MVCRLPQSRAPEREATHSVGNKSWYRNLKSTVAVTLTATMADEGAVCVHTTTPSCIKMYREVQSQAGEVSAKLMCILSCGVIAVEV